MSWQIFDPIFESDMIDPQLPLTPWSTNRRFAYDLIRFLKPKTIVELGSHYGCSLFCFAQAIKDANLDTVLTGIDTWEGDQQAGFYDEHILRKVRNIAAQKFQKVDLQLIQKRFTDALPNFPDNSISVIHIDGLHTYEAVKDDFDTWLPKLAPNGIVLFHDIAGNAASKKYGSVAHWKEVSQQYSHLEFRHNWGLGVLFPKGVAHLNVLQTEKIPVMIPLYEIASMQQLGVKQVQNDLAWQTEQTNKWWQTAMDYQYNLQQRNHSS